MLKYKNLSKKAEHFEWFGFVNFNYLNDKRGNMLINLEISRDKLKTLPKQRRKVPSNAMFGEDYLKGYRVVIR